MVNKGVHKPCTLIRLPGEQIQLCQTCDIGKKSPGMIITNGFLAPLVQETKNSRFARSSFDAQMNVHKLQHLEDVLSCQMTLGVAVFNPLIVVARVI